MRFGARERVFFVLISLELSFHQKNSLFQNLQRKGLPCFVVYVFQQERLHLLDSSVALALAVGVVQLHSDLSNVLALPVQPEDLVAELSDASSEPFELRLVLVVDLLHLFFHVQEVRGHVALHPLGDCFIHIVHRSNIPFIFSSLDFHETVVVTGLLDRLVHRKQIVEVDVRKVLRKSVLAEPDQLLHPLQIIRLGTQLLQSFLSKVQVNVQILRVVDINVVRSIVDNCRVLGT